MGGINAHLGRVLDLILEYGGCEKDFVAYCLAWSRVICSADRMAEVLGVKEGVVKGIIRRNPGLDARLLKFLEEKGCGLDTKVVGGGVK